jgi:AraC-like DNA-binding protein
MPPEIKINLHPINFVILSAILQSLILAAVLLLSRKGNRSANRLIGTFVFICSLHFAWSLVIDLNLPDIFKQILWLPYSYLWALGPLLFFYTKSLSEPGYRIRIKDSIHFLPAALEAAAQLFFIGEGIRSNLVHYVVTGFLWFRMIELIGAALSILVYGKMSLALIRRHEAMMIQNFSSQKNVTLSWLLKLIRYLRVLWMFWLAFELSFIFFLQFQAHVIPVYLLLYILLGIIAYSTYWIGIQALNKSESLIEPAAVSVPVENQNVYSRLPEDELKGYVERLDQLMREEKLYLHETLTLRMLAARLDMDANLVSYVLNSILHRSFYDYVNEFRIAEVRRKIEDPAYSHLKIVEIAYECGFNSKATFNRVFKKQTGNRPQSIGTRRLRSNHIPPYSDLILPIEPDLLNF